MNPEITSLAEALVETNDLLIGMYDLIDVTSRSLDKEELVNDILERSLRIVHADALVLTTPTGNVTVGDSPELRRSTDRSEREKTTTVSAIHGLGMAGDLTAIRTDLEFTTGDRKLLSAVLRALLGAIETVVLHERAVQTALDARDTQRAAEVAQLALPQTRPSLDDHHLFFRNEQARNTGGDLYCFHEEGDLFSFAVGDVSGKGLSAAVMMTTAVCATSAAFRDERATSPGEELGLVNDWMYEHLAEAGLFISMFIGHYRRETNELRWANAGHSPCVVSTTHGASDLRATTPPLGVFPQNDHHTNVTELDDGDIVLIASDGIVEQASETGECFGEDRLHRLLAAMSGEPASVIGAVLLQAVTTFAAGVPQSDDRTAVLLCHSPASNHAADSASETRS